MNHVLTCKCGNPIPPGKKKGTRFCSDKCRYKDRDATKVYVPRTRPFVALDGEGIQSRYVLLSSSTGNSIENLDGLTTEQCFEFLLSLPSSKNGSKPIYVWFAFDYDVNMILGDLELKNVGRSERLNRRIRKTGIGIESRAETTTENQSRIDGTIQDLREANKCTWRNYRIAYFKRKIFRISAPNGRTFTSYDLWSFFGSTFENACREWGIEIPEIITEGKAARGNFDQWTLEKLKEYNGTELELLVELATRLRKSTRPLKLGISSWHGPGAFANAWLNKNKVKESYTPLSKSIFDISSRAYFGGRIDAIGYGIANPVYHYDIISAYPAAIAHLPNLKKLEWKKSTKIQGQIFVARIAWKIPRGFWGPFPWRAVNGTIRYPLEGEGWFWYPEILAAFEKFPPECFTVKEVWFADGEIQFPLHDLIHESFQYRKELKRAGKPAHHAIKLVLNSLYGKFAQTVGKAQYYSPIWAGLITSQTRAQLLRVITDDTLCVMTDSIWSAKPLDIQESEELGGWEKQTENKLVLVEAGLYQAETKEGDKFLWQRGFDKNTPIDIEQIVGEWLTGDMTYSPSYKVHRFVAMGLASVTSHPWRNWIDIDRTIHPVPLVGTTKRLPKYPLNSREKVSRDFVKLDLRPRDSQELSAPYVKVTLDDEIIRRMLEDEAEEI